MSIVRVGLAETKKFAEGYEAIFGKKSGEGESSVSSRKASAPTSAKRAKKSTTKARKR